MRYKKIILAIAIFFTFLIYINATNNFVSLNATTKPGTISAASAISAAEDTTGPAQTPASKLKKPIKLASPVVFPDLTPEPDPTAIPVLETPTPEPTPSPTSMPTATPSPIPSPTPTPKTYIGKVALTFDDGPHKYNTDNLLDALAEYDAKATFFILGSLAEEYPDTVKRMYEEGHLIGNHSYNHKRLPDLAYSDMKWQLTKTNSIINNIAGYTPKLMRPPYGAVSSNLKSIALDLDISLILWSVDPMDWKYRDSKRVSRHILDNVKDGQIILLHDIYDSSVNAAKIVLKELSEKGYQFVTVEELLGNPAAGSTYTGKY